MTATYTRRLVGQWDWRTAALSFALIAAESTLVSLVIGLIETPGAFADGSSETTGIHPLAVMAVMLFAAAIPRIAETLQLWSPEFEAFIAGSVVLSLVGMLYSCAFATHYAPWDVRWLQETLHAFTVRPTTATASVWLITFVLIYAWARGRLRDQPALDSTYTMLRVGLVVVAITSVLTLTTQEARSPAQQFVRPLVVGFFFFALSAVTLARLQVEGLRSQGRLGPQWLVPLILPVAFVLLAGLLVAGLLSRRFLDTLTAILHPVFLVLNFILDIIITVISWIAYFCFFIFNLIFLKLSGGRQTGLPQLPQSPRDFSQQNQHNAATLPDSVRIVLFIIIGAAVVALLSRFLFNRPSGRTRGNEERESVMDWNDLGAGLRNALANLANRLRNRGTDPWAHLRGDARWEHTLRIRTMYSRLLHRGARAGAPRPPATAPREHVPALGTVFPKTDPALVTLTDLYRAARYDERPATADDAAAAERAFRAITENQPTA